jgi:flagellar biosynthesis protein FlhG
MKQTGFHSQGFAKMTRIMTITSGLPGSGVTHLAVNIALEQVRRGRQAGVFCVREGAAPVDSLLQLQQPVAMLRRADDARERGLLRSGYQGIDILSCGTPLREWPSIPVEQRTRCISEMDVPDGYDDFIFDTSDMDPRTQLACCRSAAIVVVVVTPEPRSRAEAFALLRVLQLNGLAGQLRLLVNKVGHPVDSAEIHEDFSRLVKESLGLDIPLLGSVPEDESVGRAEQVRQAFSAIFPDVPATAGVVTLVDELEDIELQFFPGPRTLAALWPALVEAIQLPVTLPGHVVLDDGDVETTPEVVPPAAEADTTVHDSGDTGLLNFQGTLAGLSSVRERLQCGFDALLADLESFTRGREREPAVVAGVNDTVLQREQLLLLLSRLLGMLEAVGPSQSLRFQVVDTTVTRIDEAWLQPGHYLKYIFHMKESMLPENARALLHTVPELVESTGTDHERIYELVDEQRDCCMNIIDDPHEGVRIQAWFSLRSDERSGEMNLQERRAPAR